MEKNKDAKEKYSVSGATFAATVLSDAKTDEL